MMDMKACKNYEVLPYTQRKTETENGLIANIPSCESRLLAQAYVSHTTYTLANKGDERNLQK